MVETSDFSIVDFFAEYQWLRRLPFVSNRWQRMKEATDNVKYFIRRQIRDRWAFFYAVHSELTLRIAAIENGTHVLDENAEDYIDAFLWKMEDGKESDEFNEENLVAKVFDLWAAGQDTTAATIQSAFVHLLNQPDVTTSLLFQ